MGWKTGAAALAVVGALTLTTGPAGAIAGLVVPGDPIEASEGDDGTWTAKVAVANTSTGPIAVDVEEANPQPDCEIDEEPAVVPAGLQRTVTLTILVDCLEDGEVPSLDLKAAEASQRLKITTKDEAATDYWALLFYAVAAVLAALASFVAVGLLSPPRQPVRAGGKVTWKSLGPTRWLCIGGDAMEHVPADWSFKDSWATNVGLAGALFTGALGASDVLEKVLGDEGDGPVAVAVLTAALATGLIGAAPLALKAFRKSAEKTGVRHPTVLGMLVAMFAVLTANLGQILSMAWLLAHGSLDGRLVWPFASVTGAVLVVYGVRNARDTLEEGYNEVPPKDTTPPDRTSAAYDLGSSLLTTAGFPEGAAPGSPAPILPPVPAASKARALMI